MTFLLKRYNMPYLMAEPEDNFQALWVPQCVLCPNEMSHILGTTQLRLQDSVSVRLQIISNILLKSKSNKQSQTTLTY